MDSSTLPSPPPQLDAGACLNATGTGSTRHGAPNEARDGALCTRCADRCPANAIALREGRPELDTAACTGCTGCVGVCPVSAITHEDVRPMRWIAEARQRQTADLGRVRAACAAVPATAADLRLPCHAAWDVSLLAGLAAEGVRTLALAGLAACADCPLRHGRTVLEQTLREWDAIQEALGVKLAIEEDKAAEPTPPAQMPEASAAPMEPPRRAFFRSLLPTLAQGAATAAAQIGQSARQALREETDQAAENDEAALPFRMRLFLKALPHLNPNFTPVPVMDGFPFGAVQATDACTACGDCLPACPTRALNLKPFGANAILELTPEACTGCGHCVAACPENALQALPAVSLPALLTGRARPLIMVAVGRQLSRNRQQSGGTQDG